MEKENYYGDIDFWDIKLAILKLFPRVPRSRFTLRSPIGGRPTTCPDITVVHRKFVLVHLPTFPAFPHFPPLMLTPMSCHCEYRGSFFYVFIMCQDVTRVSSMFYCYSDRNKMEQTTSLFYLNKAKNMFTIYLPRLFVLLWLVSSSPLFVFRQWPKEFSCLSVTPLDTPSGFIRLHMK